MTPEQAMTHAELLAEIDRLRRLLRATARRARAQNVLLDKIGAAQLRVELLLRVLRKRR